MDSNRLGVQDSAVDLSSVSQRKCESGIRLHRQFLSAVHWTAWPSERSCDMMRFFQSPFIGQPFNSRIQAHQQRPEACLEQVDNALLSPVHPSERLGITQLDHSTRSISDQIGSQLKNWHTHETFLCNRFYRPEKNCSVRSNPACICYMQIMIVIVIRSLD